MWSIEPCYISKKEAMAVVVPPDMMDFINLFVIFLRPEANVFSAFRFLGYRVVNRGQLRKICGMSLSKETRQSQSNKVKNIFRTLN